MWTRAFGENVEHALEALKETSEEANGATARKTEAEPSAKGVEVQNLDQCVQELVPALRERKGGGVRTRAKRATRGKHR